MLGASERDEDGALGRRVPRHEQRHVARRLLEDGGELLVGSTLGQELVGGVGKQELDVELGREPSQLLARRRRRERGRAGGDTARLECRPALFEPGRRGPELGCVRHKPGEDHDARRVSREQLGHRDQGVDAGLVRDRDEDRPLRNLADSGGWRFEIERRVLPEDRPLQLMKRGARFDPESVDEGPARFLVGVKGLSLPARAVQGRHQLSPETLAERVLGDEGFELSDQLVVAPEREVGVDPQLDCCKPDLAEPSDGRLGEALVGEVRERRASPERQRVAEPLRRIARQAASEQAPPLVHEPLESVEIERVGLDPDDVAGRSGRQHVLRQRLAKSRDVDPQCGGGALGRVLAPELVDQPVGRNDLVGVEEEQGEKRPRLGAAQGHARRLRPTASSGPRIRNSICLPPGAGTLTGCCRLKQA